MAKRITIQIVGSTSQREDVRLNEFLEKLNSVRKALRETEMAISGEDEPTLEYRIVDLRHSSPFTVVLEPVATNGGPPPLPELIPRVVGNFAEELGLIKREGKLLIAPDLARLRAYQDIGITEIGRIEKIKIRSGGREVTIDQRFNDKLEAIVGPDEIAHGTISGMLEAINIHNTNRFTLYPPLGPRIVHGRFHSDLRPRIKDAIGNFVTVIGRLKFKAWAPFPHGVIAEDIDIHEPDSELPNLKEVRGAFKGNTGNLNSAEFIDQLRHEDW